MEENTQPVAGTSRAGHLSTYERVFNDSLNLLDEQKFMDAIELLEKLKLALPKSSAVQYQLGFCHEMHARSLTSDAALAAHGSVNAHSRSDGNTRAPPSGDLDARDADNIVHFQHGSASHPIARYHYSLALSHYQQCTWLRPDNWRGHWRLGKLLSLRGRLSEANQHFQRVIRLRPQFGAGYAASAQVLKSQGRVVEALRTYRDGHRAANGNQATEVLTDAMLAKLIGDLNLASNHKLALFRYSKMVMQHPDDVRIHVLLGKALLKLGHHDRAEMRFKIAIKKGPDSLEAMLGLGSSLEAKGLNGFAEAEQVYERALKLSENIVNSVSQLGSADAARAMEPWLRIGVMAMQRQPKDCARAVSFLQKALIIYPASARGNHLLSRALCECGRDMDALVYGQRAVEANSSHVPYLTSLARIYQRQHRPRNAINLLERALAVDPELMQHRLQLCNLYLQVENAEAAVNCFAKSMADITLNRTMRTQYFLPVQNNMAVSYFLLGDAESAKKHLMQVHLRVYSVGEFMG